MNLNQTSKEFKKFFILQFTKELIRHTGASEVFKLGEILKEKKQHQKDLIKEKQAKDKIHEIIKEKEKELEFIKKEQSPPPKKVIPARKIPKKMPVLRIPEPRLPPTFQYLKPSPSNIQIDLEKLNPLIKDPLVKVIECNGPEENIIVNGSMGTKPTAIVLNKDEIDDIIKKFSSATKIPVHEGVYRAVTGRLILSAIISEIVGSKFIIKKMMYHPGFAPRQS